MLRSMVTSYKVVFGKFLYLVKLCLCYIQLKTPRFLNNLTPKTKTKCFGFRCQIKIKKPTSKVIFEEYLL